MSTRASTPGRRRVTAADVARSLGISRATVGFVLNNTQGQTISAATRERVLAEAERLSARKKLTRSEKELSGIIFDRLRNNESFGRIRSKGDQALFGGRTTQDMKNKLSVPDGRPLADFLPTITIKAKDFANEITNFNIKQRHLGHESGITDEHVKNNQEVRKLLVDRGIVPESLPPAEDVKKVERRLKSEQKRLPKQVESLEVPAEPVE